MFFPWRFARWSSWLDDGTCFDLSPKRAHGFMRKEAVEEAAWLCGDKTRSHTVSLRISFSFLRLLSYCGSNQPNSRSLRSADCSFPLFSVTLRFSLPVLDSPLLSLVPYESSFPFFFYLYLLVPEGEFAFDITYAKKFVKVPTYCPLVAVECSFDDDRIISSYYTL